MMDTAHLTDSHSYDLAWASNIVKRAWQQLQDAFEAEGKAEWLEVLRPFVAGRRANAAKIRKKRRKNLEFRSRRCEPGFRVCVSVIAKRSAWKWRAPFPIRPMSIKSFIIFIRF